MTVGIAVPTTVASSAPRLIPSSNPAVIARRRRRLIDEPIILFRVPRGANDPLTLTFDLRRVPRQQDLKDSAAVVAHAYRATVAFDYCFHDRQAQTAAAGGARHIRFVEPVENQRHVFWRNSGTVVADRESNMATGLFGRQRDFAAIRCVAKRIRGEILQRLFK